MQPEPNKRIKLKPATKSSLEVFQLSHHISEIPSRKYVINEKIAKGGEGIIFDCLDSNTLRNVAIKKLVNKAPGDHEIWFIKEALITAYLEHPNIIPVHEIGRDERGQLLYSMKKITGKSFGSVIFKHRNESLRKDRTNLRDLLEIFIKICDAISYAHYKNIIHLDLKPENIFVGEHGEVMVGDWGLAEHIGHDYPSNNVRMIFEGTINRDYEANIFGSPGYMAPEQITGRREDFERETDIYALGGILYSMLSACSPIASTSIQGQIEETLAGNLKSPQVRAPHRNIPNELAAISLKALSFNKKSRYQNVEQLKEDILNYMTGDSVTAMKDSLYVKIKRFYLKNRSACNLAAVVFLSVSIIFGIGYHFYQKTSFNWVENVNYKPDRSQVLMKKFFVRDMTTNEDRLLKMSEMHDDGIHISTNDGLILGQPDDLAQYPDDVKIEIEFTWKDKESVNAVEVCFNSDLQYGLGFNDVPVGYSVQIASWFRQMSYVSINNISGLPNYVNAVPYKQVEELKHTLVITRTGSDITVHLDDRLIITDSGNATLSGKPFGVIRLRHWSPGLVFNKVRISSLLSPEYANRLQIAEALAANHLYDEALDDLLTIISEYDNNELRESAVSRYLQILFYLYKITIINDETYDFHMTRLEETGFTTKETTRLIHKYLTTRLWNLGKHEEAMSLLESLQEREERAELLHFILLERHQKLSPEDGIHFLELISKNLHRKTLDVSDYGLYSLEPLRGMQLETVIIDNNFIDDISPLEDMNIKIFMAQNNKIEDLTPLIKSPLQLVQVMSNPIKSLPVFKEKTLEALILIKTQIKDITTVLDQPLRILDIRDLKIINEEEIVKSGKIKTIKRGKMPIIPAPPEQK